MSACFEYDNPLTQELSGLTARMGAIELHQEELGHSLDQGFKSQPGTTGFLVFFPFLVRSGMVNRVRFFIFYASKFKNTKVIFLCYCSGFEPCHRFLKPWVEVTDDIHGDKPGREPPTTATNARERRASSS